MRTTKCSPILRITFSCGFLILLSMAAQTLAENNEPNNKPASQVDFLDMSLEQLSEVSITVVSKKEEPQAKAPGITVIVPRSEFEMYGDRDLHQLLQRQPSVYTRDVFPYTDNVAGFRGDMGTVAEMHTLVLLNGRPIRESAQGLNVNIYKTFPLSTLESVELIRGPGSVLYGSNAFTGVVNLKTRAIPNRNEYSISSMTGSYGYYETNVTAGGKSGEFGYTTAIRTAGQQGYPYHMTDALNSYGEDNKQYKSYSAVTHLNYGNFTLDGFWSDYDAFAMGVVPFWSNPHQSFRNKKLFLNAGYQVPIDERVTLDFNLTYNLQENGLTSYKPEIIGTNTSDLLGEVTLFANPTDNTNLVLGCFQEQRSNYHPDSDKYQSIPEYRHEPKGFYAQGDYEFGKFLKFVAGTQWNKSSYGIADWISRYGVIITPAKNWGVKLLRGEAFRAPVTLETDLYDPGILRGNSSLMPEKIITYDAQLFYSDEKTYAAITYFHSTMNKLIVYDTSAVPDMSYKNGGTQGFDGIEFEAKYFFTPHWHALGSFTHQENEADIGVNPTVVPKNMAKFGTGYTWDWGTASIFCSHFGTPPEIASPVVVNPKPEALSLVSINVTIDPARWLDIRKGRATLMFKIENLFDEEIYVPTFAYSGSPNSFPYNPGRTFYCGLKINF